jgi:hypothetical protein
MSLLELEVFGDKLVLVGTTFIVLFMCRCMNLQCLGT